MGRYIHKQKHFRFSVTVNCGVSTDISTLLEFNLLEDLE